MKLASKEYIINTVYNTNILPIISSCNTRCIFCSHRQNPDGIEVFALPSMTLEDIKEISEFLSSDRKIVIGESATRIIEGEPLLHKGFVEIVSYLRKRFKNTPIQITTNGILLNDKIIAALELLGNIELNISVNCVDSEKRKAVLGLKTVNSIKEKILLIKGKLRFSGSCVMVPGILDEGDIEEIAELLDYAEADNMRLFLPGYTKYSESKGELKELYSVAIRIVDRLKEKFSLPIIVEPAFIDNLDCLIEGVIKGTPAEKAGLRCGDKITGINGREVLSRVDAFNQVYKLQNPELSILREQGVETVRLDKKKNSSPGFMTLYDVDPFVLTGIKQVTERYDLKNVLFITSRLAFGIIKELTGIGEWDFDYDVIAAKNTFFGGTIRCAGLLVIDDIAECLEEYLSDRGKPDLVFLPSIMFDNKGNDLTGKNLRALEERFGIPFETL